MIKDSPGYSLRPVAVLSTINLLLKRSSVIVKVTLCALAVGVWFSSETCFHRWLFFSLSVA